MNLNYTKKKLAPLNNFILPYPIETNHYQRNQNEKYIHQYYHTLNTRLLKLLEENIKAIYTHILNLNWINENYYTNHNSKLLHVRILELANTILHLHIISFQLNVDLTTPTLHPSCITTSYKKAPIRQGNNTIKK